MFPNRSFIKLDVVVLLAFAKRLLVVLGLCFSVWPATVQAQDHIIEKAYWTDTTGVATFEQARAATYTPYSGVLSKGFTEQIHWVKLKVEGVAPDRASQLVLRIRPVFLDYITLYDPLESEQGKAVCWFISKTEPVRRSFTTKFEPRSTYPANFVGRGVQE